MEGTTGSMLVSNAGVGRFHSLPRALFAIFLSLCALLFLVLATGQLAQHIFRRRAEYLLSQVQALELRKTPWSDARRQFQRWGSAQQLADRCDEHRCSVEINLFEPVYGFASRSYFFVHLDDYLRWRLKLSYNDGPFVRTESALLRAYMMAGGRPAKVTATVGMRDGVVWAKAFMVTIETYWHGMPGFGAGWHEFTLMADTHSVSRFSGFDSHNPQLIFHPDYVIGRPGGCEICVLGWAHFTPYADPSDVRRLMQLDLSCLTRFRPCLSEQDIMPAAWAQYLNEYPRVNAMQGEPTCSQTIIEILGRDAPNIVEAEIVSYGGKADADPSQRGLARVRVIQKLKGATNWATGNTYEIALPHRADLIIKRKSRFILFFDDPNGFQPMLADRSDGCFPVPLTESNLSVVSRGVAMDYSAIDNID